MKIAQHEYSIQLVGYSRANPDSITLEAVKLGDGRRVGHISMEMVPSQKLVKLSKIATRYVVPVWPRSVIDYGQNGIATRLLLEGMTRVYDNGICNLVGKFVVPEDELYRTKSWYEKRAITVSADLQEISGVVSTIIAACQSIIAKY